MSAAGVRPTILLDAVIALYPSDGSGKLLLDSPAAIGSCQEGFAWEESFEEIDVTPTGASRRVYHRPPPTHTIELQRTWMIPVSGVDFNTGRQDSYGLVVTWRDQRTDRWFQRTYWDARSRSRSQRTNGVLDVRETITFRASDCTETPGLGDATAWPDGVWHNVPFTRDAAWASGDYLHGVYRWIVPVRIKRLAIHCTAQAVVELVIDNQFPNPVELDSNDLQAWTGDILVPPGCHVRVKVKEVLGLNPAGAVVMSVVADPSVLVGRGDIQAWLIAHTEGEMFSRTLSTYDENDVLNGSPLVWPDGTAGTLNVTEKNAVFYTVDAFTATYEPVFGARWMVTQSAVERNAAGDVTHKPRPVAAQIT